MVESLHISSRFLHKHRTKASNIKPGWKDPVEELYAEARNAFKKWAESGKGKHGPVFENKKNVLIQDFNLHFATLKEMKIL